ncbi:hypothetical protein A1O7_01982 [Cladophialophora yegresii CBS 114405]|uniref:DUF6590 domain-containing protein n=1 Tax=Cladophialophora yegresii CBS 114405 TaxID=1182544 RepID=W9WT89_9EURO|nr:uncharacterized protein A1O7_01982 [Cladophialophora yegresii CBS 114405]EXJ61554.1 hypothetical protein A1O7_01982 [Cladophialophora yegresii CBS 114405]
MGGRVEANPSPEDNQGDCYVIIQIWLGRSPSQQRTAILARATVLQPSPARLQYLPKQCEEPSVSSPKVSIAHSDKNALLIYRSPPSNYVPAPGPVRAPARQPVQHPPVQPAGPGMETYGSAQSPIQQTTSRVQSSNVPRGNDPPLTGRPITNASTYGAGQAAKGDTVESLLPRIGNIDLQSPQRPDQNNVPGANQQPQGTISRAPAKGQPETTPRKYSVPAEATFFHQDPTQLDGRYVVRPSSFYVVGRVFAVLWHEGYNTGTSQNTYISDNNDNKVQVSTGRYNEPIYSSIRRMVVVRQDRGYCVCLQINTYGNRGLSKFGRSSEDVEAHSRIFMVGTEPKWLDREILISSKRDIAVKKASPEQRLSVASRLCYGRVHTVEHTVKSMDVGQVTDDALPYLQIYFRDRQNRNVR